MLPHFYETAWFRLLCAAGAGGCAWAVYQLRLRQIRYRFALVLEERARLAREIHDTLAQGFVGISSQLDAVAMCMPESTTPARKYLDLARRMARHSLTEARRSVMDLRASVLEGQDLAAALESGTRMWTAGSGVEVEVDVTGPQPSPAAGNGAASAAHRAGGRDQRAEARRREQDLGSSCTWKRASCTCGSRTTDAASSSTDVFSSLGGHFGLIGMRERAERLGGELRLASHPGEGTEVEVTVPLP